MKENQPKWGPLWPLQYWHTVHCVCLPLLLWDLVPAVIRHHVYPERVPANFQKIQPQGVRQQNLLSERGEFLELFFCSFTCFCLLSCFEAFLLSWHYATLMHSTVRNCWYFVFYSGDSISLVTFVAHNFVLIIHFESWFNFDWMNEKFNSENKYKNCTKRKKSKSKVKGSSASYGIYCHPEKLSNTRWAHRVASVWCERTTFSLNYWFLQFYHLLVRLQWINLIKYASTISTVSK